MKKTMKLFALLLAAAMLFALAACGNEETPAADSGEKKTIVYGTSADYPPFEFHVLKDGVDTIVGLDVSMAQKIADDMGAELVIKDISFDNLCIELSQGTVDFVLAAMEQSEDRDKLVDFSDPYYTDVPPKIVVVKGNEGNYSDLSDFSALTVGAQTGTTKADIVTGDMGVTTPLLLASVNDLINSLVNEKCQAIVLDGAVADKYVAANDNLAIVDIPLGDTEVEPYRVAVQEGDPDGLLESINKSIKDAIDQGLLTTWAEEADTLSSEAIGLE